MPVVRRQAVLSAPQTAAALRPWHGVVDETLVVDGPGTGVGSGADAGTTVEGTARFAAETGPVHHWTRTVQVEPRADGSATVTQTVDVRLDLPLFAWLFWLPVRHEATRLPLRANPPWWAPPAALDRRGARTLCALAIVALITGYLGTLITQTLTFVGADLGLDSAGQAGLLALVRIDVVVAFGVSALADRWGRRPVMLWSTAGALIATLVSGAAPNLGVYTAAQVAARGLTAAAAIVFAVVAAEELPARSRGWGASILAMIAAVGSGNCVLVLQLADVAPWGWRLLYVVPLVYVPLLVVAASVLGESRRFNVATHHPTAPPPGRASEQVPATPAAGSPARTTAGAATRCWRLPWPGPSLGHLRGVMGRLVLLSVSLALVSLYLTPTNQLQNDFLRTRWGYSGAMITLFTLVTGTPMGVGVALGGKLSDVWGRRLVGAVGLVGGALGTVLSYLSPVEWGLWTGRLVGGVVAGMSVPALAVYGPELFPTRLRGMANGVITATSRVGAVLGLLLASLLIRTLGGMGPAAAVLAAGPLVAAAMVLAFYPETAGVELEDLNPSDRDVDPPAT